MDTLYIEVVHCKLESARETTFPSLNGNLNRTRSYNGGTGQRNAPKYTNTVTSKYTNTERSVFQNYWEILYCRQEIARCCFDWHVVCVALAAKSDSKVYSLSPSKFLLASSVYIHYLLHVPIKINTEFSTNEQKRAEQKYTWKSEGFSPWGTSSGDISLCLRKRNIFLLKHKRKRPKNLGGLVPYSEDQRYTMMQ